MSAEASPRYTSIAIALHWAMAALLLFMIWLGWNMDDNEVRYQLHKSIGITILFLALSRLAWRFANPPPPLPEGMPAYEKMASHAVHMAFYFLMIGIPLGGWFMVSVSPFQVSTVLFGQVSWPHLPFTEGLIGKELYEFVANIHGKGAWVIIVLLVLHVAGAVKHELAAEDGVLKRMIPALFGKTNRPALPARGALFAFGGSIVLFAAIATVPLLGASGAKSTPAGAPIEMAGNWDVDYSQSKISFSGLHEGNRFDGVFGNWTADITFEPDALADAKVHAVVDTRTAKTGTKLYDDSLKSKEWFNVAEFPEATVDLSDFRIDGTGYAATATLTLKGVRASVPLNFTLDIAGDTATLDATAEFSRKALNLGQSSDPGASWVADAITVNVTGQAKRKR